MEANKFPVGPRVVLDREMPDLEVPTCTNSYLCFRLSESLQGIVLFFDYHFGFTRMPCIFL